MSEVAAARACPHCAAEVPANDRFCEECGAALALSTEVAAEAPTDVAEEAQPESAPACSHCSAGADDIDAEGFCTGCGLRREARGRDRMEIVLSPALAGVSDRGLRHHRNEDYLALHLLPGGELNPRAVLIVCDGVSSSRDADVASQTATECVSALLADTEELAADQRARALTACFSAAQSAVAAIPFQGVSEMDHAATTIVVALVSADRIDIGWLGDSRAYWIDSTGAKQLTRDDSWSNEVVLSGEMTEAEAAQSKNAHAITRWLGAGAPGEGSPSLIDFEIPGAGKLLVCSDGLWNYAAEPGAMFDLVRSMPGDAAGIARGLVDFARSKGGHDNITAALLCLDAAPLTQSDDPV